MSDRMFQEMFPILLTPDMGRALWFYRDLLGFELQYQFPPEGEPGYVGLQLGPSHLGIGFQAGATPATGRFAFWVYTDDCDAAVEHLRGHGVTVVDEPADQPWGERMAIVEDPDGNRIHVASRG